MEWNGMEWEWRGGKGAESCDRQVGDKMGDSFDEVFLPTMKKRIEAGSTHHEVERLLKIQDLGGRDQRGAVRGTGAQSLGRRRNPEAVTRVERMGLSVRVGRPTKGDGR